VTRSNLNVLKSHFFSMYLNRSKY